jgi:hypothetical protein
MGCLFPGPHDAMLGAVCRLDPELKSNRPRGAPSEWVRILSLAMQTVYIPVSELKENTADTIY